MGAGGETVTWALLCGVRSSLLPVCPGCTCARSLLLRAAPALASWDRAPDPGLDEGRLLLGRGGGGNCSEPLVVGAGSSLGGGAWVCLLPGGLCLPAGGCWGLEDCLLRGSFVCVLCALSAAEAALLGGAAGKLAAAGASEGGFVLPPERWWSGAWALPPLSALLPGWPDREGARFPSSPARLVDACCGCCACGAFDSNVATLSGFLAGGGGSCCFARLSRCSPAALAGAEGELCCVRLGLAGG